MKKYHWVILVLLLVIGVIVWFFARSSQVEQNFQGIFIMEESPSISI